MTNCIFHLREADSTKNVFLTWLAPQTTKMNQILRSDWLPERARWSYFAHSGLPAVSHKKNFPESHIINPLLTRLVLSRWLDIGLDIGQYPAILTKQAWSITHIFLYSKWTLTPLFIHHLLSSYLSITITIVKQVILFHKKTT